MEPTLVSTPIPESAYLEKTTLQYLLNEAYVDGHAMGYDEGWQAGYDAGYLAADSYIQFEGEGI